MTRRRVDLPAPLVPSRASTSPRRDLEADVEQDLHVAVGEVDVGDLQGREVLGIGLLATALLVLLTDRRPPSWPGRR